MSTPQLLKATLKRAPFCIFSKTAPATLPQYDVDNDFCYYFFNDAMEHFSGISPHFLTANNDRNAKTDFPTDHERYFADDAAVCQTYPFPAIKSITEPWTTPAMDTTVETRKTAVLHEGQNYMLGCFNPHDGIELGATKFRATVLPPALEPIPNVDDGWYAAAFRQLPLAVALIDTEGGTGGGTVVAANDLARSSFLGEGDEVPTVDGGGRDAGKNVRAVEVADGLERAAAAPGFGCYGIGSENGRTWIWRPDPARPAVVAVAVRERRPTGHPGRVGGGSAE